VTRRFHGRPGAACASTTSANEHFYEHDHGPLEHPKPPNSWLGRLLARLKVAFQSRTTAGGARGQGSRLPNLDTPQRDCSRQGLRPNLDRSGRLMSRAPFFALPGETRGRERCRRVAPTCTAGATQRVVRRSISAKKSDAHQPEVPSVPRPSRGTEACFQSGANRLKVTDAFFTGRDSIEGRSFESRTARPSTETAANRLFNRAPQRSP